MHRTHSNSGSHDGAAMSRARSWMLYGATGHTGTLIARHAHQRGHRPMLAGRTCQPSPRWPRPRPAVPGGGPG